MRIARPCALLPVARRELRGAARRACGRRGCGRQAVRVRAAAEVEMLAWPARTLALELPDYCSRPSARLPADGAKPRQGGDGGGRTLPTAAWPVCGAQVAAARTARGASGARAGLSVRSDRRPLRPSLRRMRLGQPGMGGPRRPPEG